MLRPFFDTGPNGGALARELHRCKETKVIYFVGLTAQRAMINSAQVNKSDIGYLIAIEGDGMGGRSGADAQERKIISSLLSVHDSCLGDFFSDSTLQSEYLWQKLLRRS